MTVERGYLSGKDAEEKQQMEIRLEKVVEINKSVTNEGAGRSREMTSHPATGEGRRRSSNYNKKKTRNQVPTVDKRRTKKQGILGVRVRLFFIHLCD